MVGHRNSDTLVCVVEALLVLLLGACAPSARPTAEIAGRASSAGQDGTVADEARREPAAAPAASASETRTLPSEELPRSDECARAPQRASNAAMPPVTTVTYSRPNGAALSLDVARPADDALRPAVVLLHGGGWASGSRAYTRAPMRSLAARGYVGVSVDYRLARRRSRFPAAVADVRCAIRFLRANHARFGIDPARIVAMGFSAGGHLAAMLAVAPDVEALDDGTCDVVGVGPEVAAAVAWYAPFDLRVWRGERPRAARIVRAFLGATPEESPELAALASPVEHVGPSDAPLLIVHGTADTVVTLAEPRAMLSAMRDAGVRAHLVEVSEGRHGFPFDGPSHRVATCTTLAFLEEVLE